MRMESVGLPRVWFVSLIIYAVIYLSPKGCTVYGMALLPPTNRTRTVAISAEHVQEGKHTKQSNTSLIQTIAKKPRGGKETDLPMPRPTVAFDREFEDMEPEIRDYVQRYRTEEAVPGGTAFHVSDFDDSEMDEDEDKMNDANKMVHYRNKPLVDGASLSDRLKKRHIFGKDERVLLPRSLTQKLPFSAVVRLGNSCSGTLIWYKHVLTAAHCVHNGDKLFPLSKLNVGILRQSGTFKWFKAKKVFVANQWLRKEGLDKLGHDYAVIELHKRHGHEYMRFGYEQTQVGRHIQFAGFPSDKPMNEMWFSRCKITLPKKRKLYNNCDATTGMSGSGVYIYQKKTSSSRGASKMNESERKVIAVLSTFIGRYAKEKFIWGSNVATRLTKKKVERICHWIKAGRGCRWIRR